VTGRAAFALLVALTACQPALPYDAWLVTSARVLGVKSEPAEAKAGAPVTYTAFIADPDASSAPSAPAWAFCTAPKPPTENDSVSSACLDPGALVELGQGLSIVAATPDDACRRFGPAAVGGGLRPRDADVTGGYYQPLRLDLPGQDPVFHLQRVLCGLADAGADLATEYGLEYAANTNPQLAALSASIAGEPVALDRIPGGARVDLVASWSDADAESYVYLDRASLALVTRREALRVAWHVNGGSLDTESSGRAETDLATSTGNVWLAPRSAGAFTLWLVLRDSRGGTDFARYSLSVMSVP
jgi:hypothetical protein